MFYNESLLPLNKKRFQKEKKQIKYLQQWSPTKQTVKSKPIKAQLQERSQSLGWSWLMWRRNQRVKRCRRTLCSETLHTEVKVHVFVFLGDLSLITIQSQSPPPPLLKKSKPVSSIRTWWCTLDRSAAFQTQQRWWGLSHGPRSCHTDLRCPSWAGAGRSCPVLECIPPPGPEPRTSPWSSRLRPWRICWRRRRLWQSSSLKDKDEGF